MDTPDSTEANLNVSLSLDSDYFLDKPNNQLDDSFLRDLFQSHLTKKDPEDVTNGRDSVKENNSNSDTNPSLPGSPKWENEKSICGKEAYEVTTMIQSMKHENMVLKEECSNLKSKCINLKDESSKYKIECKKWEDKYTGFSSNYKKLNDKYTELKNSYAALSDSYVELNNTYTELEDETAKCRSEKLQDESELAKYEERLSECMTKLMTLETKLQASEESNQTLGNENLFYKMKLEEREAELKQFKSLVTKQVTSEEEMFALKKDSLEKAKVLKKVERELQHFSESSNKKSRIIMCLKRDSKKLMARLLECQERLINNGLLSVKEMKSLCAFIEHFKRSLNRDDVSEDSFSQEEENTTIDNPLTSSAENNTPLSNGTFVKKEISFDEDQPNTCSNSEHPSTNAFLLPPNIDSSTAIKISPTFNDKPYSTNMHSDISRNNKKSHVFQLPFNSVSCKVEDSSNECIQNDKSLQCNSTGVTVNSNVSHLGAFGAESISSDDVEITDECINLKDIMGDMVIKDLSLISPIPESPLRKFYLHSDKIKRGRNDAYAQISSKNCGFNEKEVATKSNVCKKNRLFHQTSSGFEPHIEERFENTNSTVNQTSIIAKNPSQTLIPPNLHYISSTYSNNNYEILHQGNGVFDCIVNPDTKLSACVLTIPRESSKNSTNNNQEDTALPSKSKRINSVLALYNAATKQVSSVKKENNLVENKTDNSENNHLSYICVRIDNKNGQVNLTSNVENNSVPNIESNRCLAIQEQSSEVMQEENHMPEYDEMVTDDNHPFVSSSCDISPSETKTYFHGIDQSELNMRNHENPLPVIVKTVGNYVESNETGLFNQPEENESILPDEISKLGYSSSENPAHLSSYPRSNENSSVESEMSYDTNLNNQFSIFEDHLNSIKIPFVVEANDVLENSKVEVISPFGPCSLSNGSVLSETAISTFDNSKILNKASIHSPKHNISNGKCKSEDEILYPFITCNSNLQSSTSPSKQNFFQSIDSKSSKQTVENKSSDVCDNSRKSENEVKKAVTKHPCLKSEIIISLKTDAEINKPSVKQNLSPDVELKSLGKYSVRSKSCDTNANSEKSENEFSKTPIKHTCQKSETISEPHEKENFFSHADFKSNRQTLKGIFHNTFMSLKNSEKELVETAKKHICPESETITNLSPCEEISEPHIKQISFQDELESPSKQTLESKPSITSDNLKKSGKEFLKTAKISCLNSDIVNLSIDKDDLELKSPAKQTLESKFFDEGINTPHIKQSFLENVELKSPVKGILESKSCVASDNSKKSEKELQKVTIKCEESSFQHVGFQSPATQTPESKSYDTCENLHKSEKELENTAIKQPCIKSKTAITLSPDRKKNIQLSGKKLRNFTDLSTENVFSADIEPSASRKRKLSEISSHKMLAKNDPSETLNDPSIDPLKITSKYSPKKLRSFQSSIHILGCSSMSKSYGVFKKDNINFSSNCDGEKANMFTEISSVNSVKVIPNQNANDLFDVASANNLSNVSQKKKKKRNKKKKKQSRIMQNLSNEICQKNSKKSCHNQKSSNLSSLQKSPKTQLLVKQQLQNISKNPSSSIFECNKLKSNSKSSGPEKNNPVEFKMDTQINSDAKVNAVNNFNTPPFENKITRNNEEVTSPNHHLHFNVEASIPSGKRSGRKKKTFAMTINQNKFAEYDKKNSDNIQLSKDLVNDKKNCKLLSLSNVTISESVEVGIKKNLSPKGGIQIHPRPHEHSVKVTNASVTDISAEDNEKSTVSVAKIENSFGTEVIGNSQNEVNKVSASHNSFESSISDDENPLVIADEVETNPIFETEPNIENKRDETVIAVPENFTVEIKSEESLSVEIQRPTGKSKQKRKNSKTRNSNKRTKSKNSCEVESPRISNVCAIETVLDDIKKMKIESILTNHSNYKLLQHQLVNSLINPSNAPNTTSALYLIFKFLSSSKLNPLLSFLVKKDISFFFPPAENCIVEALIKVEYRKKIHLEGLISSAIFTLYYLVLDKKSISKTGLGALCRVFTQLCKHTNQVQKPIALCCDLIKEQHPYAPVLVAFVMGVWLELFEPEKEKNEFSLLHLSSISFGLQTKPSTVTSTDWSACKAVFQKAAVPLPLDLQAATDFLIQCMNVLVTHPPSDSDKWAVDQMMIFAVTKGWTWTEEKIVKIIVDLVVHYATDEENERAFSFFADVCADIGKLAPSDCLSVLQVLSGLFMDDYEFDYVKKHAAHSLLKLLLSKHVPVPDVLSQYIQENASSLNIANVELYLRRRCIADAADFTENDIIVT